MPYVKVDKRKLEHELKKFDWSKVDAMSDDDIARQIASNPDTVDPANIDFKNWVLVEPFQPKRVKALRRRMKLSQSRFARSFGLRLRTIQEWEQGRRQPEEAARILLRVIEREPKAVQRALEGWR